MTNPHEAALEAAAEGVMAEMPVDRGTTFEQAAQVYAQAAITAYLTAMREAGRVLVDVGELERAGVVLTARDT